MEIQQKKLVTENKMKLLLLEKNSFLNSNKKYVNLSTKGIYESYFFQKKIKLLKPVKSNKILSIYNDRINDHLENLFRSFKKEKIFELISYMTFSKLVVSDDLVNKFWVIYNIDFFKAQDVILLIDDKTIFNHFNGKKNNFSIFPLKIFYRFSLFFIKLFFSFFKKKFSIKNNFNLFVGNVFLKEKFIQKKYNEYFFSKYWTNHRNAKLILINNSLFKNFFFKSEDIFFKVGLLSIKDLLNTLFKSIVHFFKPFRINEKDVFDSFINYNLIKDSKSSSFFDAYINVYIFKNLAKSLSNKKGKIIIPHEGRVYEKIIYYIFKDVENINVIGYSHFPLSKKIQNLNFSPLHKLIYNDYNIYTLGKINSNILIENFNWPKKFIKLGAHLKKSIPPKIKNISSKSGYLVLLGMEYIPNLRLLNFIKLNLSTNKKIFVRSHPSAVKKKQLIYLCQSFGFEFSKNTNIYNDLSKANVIFYGDTGAIIECLIDGVCLNYISDDVFLDSDRLNTPKIIHNRLDSLKIYDDKFFNKSIKNFENLKSKYISKINPSEFEFK